MACSIVRRAFPAAPIFLITLALLSGLRPAGALTPLPAGNAEYDEASRTLFLDDEILFVEVTVDPADLADLIADPWANEYKRCTVRIHNSMIDETLDDVGIRVRGNTSRGALKKSWKLRFDEFVDGRKFHGLVKMNLNGDRNDPSICRSKLCWDLLKEVRVPSPRTNHVRLKINDGADVEGAYINVEQADHLMMEAWFGNGRGSLYKCSFKGGSDGRADLRYIEPGDGAAYRNLGGGKTYEEENFDSPTHEDLAGFIDFIAHASDDEFTARLADHLNVDTFLRAMALDMVIGNWDGYWYGANNYYLYRNEATDRFEYIPHDLDNTFGVDFFSINWATRGFSGWGSGGFGSSDINSCYRCSLPPLMERVLSVQLFRDQMRWYAREYSTGAFALARQEDKIDRLRLMLGPYAYTGSFANGYMDNGFTNANFWASFTDPEVFVNNYGPWDFGIKPYIESRASFINSAYSPPLRPKVRVNEIVARNRNGDRDEQGEREDWVELHNFGFSHENLAGMYLSDDPDNPRKWAVPEGVSIPSESYLRIWCDGDTAAGPLHTNFRLDADGDGVGLYDVDDNLNRLVDYLDYGKLTKDVSWGRLAGSHGTLVYMVEPTPGEENRFAGNLAPVIGEVLHTPSSPREEEPVAVTARVDDLDGLLSAITLFYEVESTVDSVSMRDDGFSGDAAAGDGLFGTTIPGQPEGAIVRYWIEANDDSGATGADPIGAPEEAHGFQINYLYPGLLINEVMASNTTTLTDEAGDYDDWIELYNSSRTTIDLSDLTLSDDYAVPDLFSLPAISLEPGGFLIVWCDGEPDEGEVHAPFKLSSAGEGIALFAGRAVGRIAIDSLHYPALEDDRSYGREKDGASPWLVRDNPTPGLSNNGSDIFPDPWRGGARPLAVWPNPAVAGKGNGTIGFHLARAGRAVIRLYDLAGRERFLILDDQFGPGDRRVPWNPTALLEEEEFAPGLYFLRLEAEGRHESARVFLIH